MSIVSKLYGKVLVVKRIREGTSEICVEQGRFRRGKGCMYSIHGQVCGRYFAIDKNVYWVFMV